MRPVQFTVRYGRVGGKHRYTHTSFRSLDQAVERADDLLRGGVHGGWPQDECRVWVEDNQGHVVHGEKATS